MAIYQGKYLIDQMNHLTVQPNCLAVWGMGQMGVAVKGSDGRIIYIDPVLTNVVAIKIPSVADKFTRAFPAPLKPEEVNNADFVFCSHEHLDHTDPLTLGPLAKVSPQAKFITTGWAGSLLDEAGIELNRRIVPKHGEPLDLDGLRVSIIPAAHDEMEFDAVKGYRFFSIQLEWGGVRLFHSGDTRVTTEYLTRLHTLPAADIALVSANGRDEYRKSLDVLGNLHPAEAVWLAKEMGWDMVIGGHNDLFEWNTIGAGSLAEAVHKYNPRQKYRCQLQPGELLYYVK
jgi:L-ascorbate 6-phosphate lactonase